MKTLFIFSFLLFSVFGFSQNKFNISIGSNFPLNYSQNELYRRFGSELGFTYTFKIKNTVKLETGLLIDGQARKNIKVFNDYFNQYFTTSHAQYSLYIPVLVNFSLSKEKRVLKTGLSFSAKDILNFTNYSGLFEYPNTSKIYGVDFNINLQYNFCKYIGTYLSYKTRLQSLPGYGIASLGLQFSFGK
ncbi:MAG: hypothetical protein IPO21_04095 [Bacteroidales bacterium]|nr:hypothetical protein [Bacteroidales bacterium]